MTSDSPCQEDQSMNQGRQQAYKVHLIHLSGAFIQSDLRQTEGLQVICASFKLNPQTFFIVSESYLLRYIAKSSDNTLRKICSLSHRSVCCLTAADPLGRRSNPPQRHWAFAAYTPIWRPVTMAIYLCRCSQIWIFYSIKLHVKFISEEAESIF